MEGHTRGTNSEDEYFARRAGEMERERDRRDAARREPEEPQATPPPPSEPKRGGASKILGAVSSAMKALFGLGA